MGDRLRHPAPAEIWEHRRTARQVQVLTVPPDARVYNARVMVRAQRRSAILLHAFLRDYRPLDEALT